MSEFELTTKIYVREATWEILEREGGDFFRSVNPPEGLAWCDAVLRGEVVVLGEVGRAVLYPGHVKLAYDEKSKICYVNVEDKVFKFNPNIDSFWISLLILRYSFEQVFNFYQSLLEQGIIRYSKQLFIIEGPDGAGKTGLAIALAQEMIERRVNNGKVCVLRGSGTTGAIDILNGSWLTALESYEIVNDQGEKETPYAQDARQLRNHLAYIVKLQERYASTKELGIVIRMHIEMLKFIRIFVEKGYIVICDRGIPSFFSAAAQRIPEDGKYKDIISQIIRSAGGYTYMGQILVVDAKESVAIERTKGKGETRPSWLNRLEYWTRRTTYLYWVTRLCKDKEQLGKNVIENNGEFKKALYKLMSTVNSFLGLETN